MSGPRIFKSGSCLFFQSVHIRIRSTCSLNNIATQVVPADQTDSERTSLTADLIQAPTSSTYCRPSLAEARIQRFRLSRLNLPNLSRSSIRTIRNTHYIKMRISMDIEAKTPLLEKRAYSEAERAAPSIETAFPMRERLTHLLRRQC